mgnify:CR=1 FL=1
MVNTKTKVPDDLRVANTTVTSKVEQGFGTQLLETSGDEEVSIIEVSMIEEDNGWEAYQVDKRSSE